MIIEYKVMIKRTKSFFYYQLERLDWCIFQTGQLHGHDFFFPGLKVFVNQCNEFIC